MIPDLMHISQEPVLNLSEDSFRNDSKAISNGNSSDFQASIHDSSLSTFLSSASSSKDKSSEDNCLTNSDEDISNIGNNHCSKRKYFTKSEDHLLILAANKYNQGSWNAIAQCVPGKNPKQCRDRWVNYLQPTLTFMPWSDNENHLLVSLVNKFGTHWSKMKKFFPNRSTNCIKNRWYWLLKNQVKSIPLQQSLMPFQAYYPNNKHIEYQNYFVESKKSNIEKSNYARSSHNNDQFSVNDIISDSNIPFYDIQQKSNQNFYFLVNNNTQINKYSKSTSMRRDFIKKSRNRKKNIKRKKNNLDSKFPKADIDELITFKPEDLDW